MATLCSYSAQRGTWCIGTRRAPARAPRSRLLVKSSNEASTSSQVCKTCGVDLSKAASGCDGEGRIIGGLGAVPGFKWWPIKAYRPCPSLTGAGMEYVRKGQAVNEVLFGGTSLGAKGAASLDEMKKIGEKGIKIE